jgi:hypothetical protein
MLPSRPSVSDDSGRLIGSGFSKTLVAVWSEKRVLRIGFEHGNPWNFRWHMPWPLSCSQPLDIEKRAHPDTTILVSRASGRPTSKSNFPVFRSAATQTPYPVSNVLVEPSGRLIFPHWSEEAHGFLGGRNLGYYTQNRRPMPTTPVKSACNAVIAISLRR